jgi:hypothetical protein
VIRRRGDRPPPRVPIARSVLISAAVLTASALATPGVRAQAVPAADPAGGSPVDSAALVPRRDVADLIMALIRRPLPLEYAHEARQGLSLTLLPSIGYNPSYGAFIGVSVAIGGWLGDPKTTLQSAGSIGASYSTTGQISLQFKSDFYAPDNRWALKGDWRYLDTSQPTFGLGPTDPSQTSYPMDFVLYRLYQTVYKRVGTNAYVGLGYHFDRYDQIHDTRAEQGEATPFSVYSGGTPSRTQSSALSANILIDTRDNPINGKRGVFWNASMRSFLKGIGSDQDRQILWSDFRSYTRLPRDGRNVLAIWNYMWFTFGQAPYLDLPAIGWDTYGRSGRGFLQGRIRGPDQVYVEFEYRMRFTRDDLWGGVAFFNLTNTNGSNGGSFGTMDPGGGAGVRLKFNKKTDTNLAVDAAWGQDENVRFFFGLQEVF